MAAATPFHRDWGLVIMQGELRPSGPEDIARLAAFAALEKHIEGDCKESLRFLSSRDQWRRLVELGEQCNTVLSLRNAARAYVLLGEYERASDLIMRTPASRLAEPTENDVFLDPYAHLLAGRFEEAAQSLRFHAEAVERIYDDNEGRTNHIATVECIALALEARDNESRAESIEELRARLGGPVGTRCGVLLADLLTGSERLQVLGSLKDVEAGLSEVVEDLGVEAEPSRISRLDSLAIGFPAWVVAGNSTGMQYHRGLRKTTLAVLEKLQEPSARQRARRASLSSDLAMNLAIMGDTKEARRLIAQSIADVDPLDEEAAYRRHRMQLISVAVAIRAGDLEDAKRQLDGVPEGREPGWKVELAGVIEYMTERKMDSRDPSSSAHL